MNRSWLDLHAPEGRSSLYFKALGKRAISGRQLPDRGLRCFLRVDPKNLAQYRNLCRFSDDGRLPPTYPHVMAFNLQLQLLTAADFPFPLLGLVHLHNEIEVRRPLGAIEGLRFAVYADNLQAHAKGGTFDLITEAQDGLGLLWRETSRMLVKGLKLDVPQAASPAFPTREDLPEVSRWYADADIGRRYARVCGDYNPIHLSTASARLFGFPKAIAHGLWSKAMTLAKLRGHLPVAGYAFAVDFHKPVRLPSQVLLAASAAGPQGQLILRAQGADLLHMAGSWRAL